MFFKFKLDEYNEDYYRIYERLDNVDFDTIPSFREMKKMIALEPGEKILDAGCGDGHLLDYFCKGLELEAYGIDSSEKAVELASKKYPHLKTAVGDLKDLDFPSDHFDKIVCYNVIEHIDGQDKVMTELKRVLKSGGVIVTGTIISDSICWKLYQLFIGEHTHVKEFNVKEFVKFVREFFEVKECRVLSGVFRFSAPLSWVFHYVLKGDIIVSAEK